MQTSVCGDVSLDNHELSLESDVANQAQEKRLPLPKRPTTNRMVDAPALNLFEVAQNGFDFMGFARPGCVEADGWYDASRKDRRIANRSRALIALILASVTILDLERLLRPFPPKANHPIDHRPFVDSLY